MRTSKFEEIFKNRKPVIGMLHLRGNGAEKVRIAREEAKIMCGEGVDAVLVENYLNSTALDCEAVLRTAGIMCCRGWNSRSGTAAS